mgnify:CR=1 FL=1
MVFIDYEVCLRLLELALKKAPKGAFSEIIT